MRSPHAILPRRKILKQNYEYINSVTKRKVSEIMNGLRIIILVLITAQVMLIGQQALSAEVANAFDYPVGTPRSQGGTGYVTQANDGDRWYNAQDWQVYNSDYGGYHPGEDWNDERGESSDLSAPVYAIANGVVTAITSNVPGEGIAIKHTLPNDESIFSVYIHIAIKSGLSVGSSVIQGEQIGTIADITPLSSHLHFEIRTKMESDWYPNDNGNGYYTSKETLYSNGFTVDPSNFIDDHRPISSDLGEAAAVLAESVAGAPYLWGGKGWDLNYNKFVESNDILSGYNYYDPISKIVKVGSGLDCSGLVYWSYNKAAGLQDSPVNIPDQCPVYFEGASGQWSDTKRLEKLGGPTDIPSRYDLKTGDLLFLQNTETPTSGIDHVGIYVGDGEVVHAKGPIDTGHIEKATLGDWLILPTSDGKKYKDHFAGYGRIISPRWNGMSGVLASRPVTLKSSSGQNHVFVKGGDNRLWDNIDGTWQGLGGVITSESCAVKDGMGLIHIFVIGTDGALWDRVLGASWARLGGYITSNPSAALSPNGQIKIAVKGGDNALWIKDFTTGSWSRLGGYITSNPQMIYDSQGRMHVFVRGSDGALWDYAGSSGGWQLLRGQITSDAMPILNPLEPDLIYIYARGGNGALWVNKFNINTAKGNWQNLGGFISPTNGGCPAPIVDADGIIHTFVQGGDRALWDNANGYWYSLGGCITTDPNAMRDKNGRLRVAVRGGDNALWVNTIGINQIPITLVGPNACDYTKIQAAVDVSPSGGMIKVLSGTYTENVHIDKSLTIIGAGEGKTIVDGNQAGSVFTIGGDDVRIDIDVTLSGMTIQNGKTTTPGGGIKKGTKNFGDLTILDTTISSNTARFGGGIYTSLGTTTIINSYISKNTAMEANGGGIISGSALTVTGCIISENKAISSGGGVYHSGSFTMNGGTISGNSAKEGGGVYTYYTSGIYPLVSIFTMNGGTISGNSAKEGGGIRNWFGELWVGGTSQIGDNQATSGYGGGISSNGNVVVTLDGTGVAVKSNLAHLPDPLPADAPWYKQYGVYMDGIPITTNGFDPATQVTGNIKI